MYDAVVFDMDGVLLRPLINSSNRYADAVTNTFNSFDANPSQSDIEAFYGGLETLDEMRKRCERYNIDLGTFWVEREQRISAVQQQMMERGERELYEDYTVLPRLVKNYDLGLVSTNQHETVEFMIRYFGLDEYFEAVYGREPTIQGFQRTKPDPYYIERALRDLGTSSAIYVGDSVSDIAAAHQTGLDSVFVWREHRSDYDLTETPTYEVNQLTELPEKLQC